MSVEEHGSRLDKVESEVSTIRTEMAGLKSDVRGLGSILSRIEQGVASAQQRFDDDKHASRVNPIALATVLLAIITTLIGGAWLIGGELARQDEQNIYQQRTIDTTERRQWDITHGAAHSLEQ